MNERILATDILSELGTPDENKYYEFAVTNLIQALDDSNHHVIASAGHALGKRLKLDDYRAIPKLISLSEHTSCYVRFSLTSALSGVEHPDAIKTLIKLSYDDDFDVRNWAIFAIGSQIRTDTPEIRRVLKNHLNDDNYEIRGEALVGLAERGDEIALEAVKKELSKAFEGSYAIEASERLADESLVPYLDNLKSQYSDEMTGYHLSKLDDAITACLNKSNDNA